MAFCNFYGNPNVNKIKVRCYILSHLHLTTAEIAAQLFQISSCCFPWNFLQFSLCFQRSAKDFNKIYMLIWGLFPLWFLPFQNFLLPFTAPLLAPNLPLTPQFDKTADFITVWCRMNWEMPSQKKSNKCGSDSKQFNSFEGWIYHNFCLLFVILMCLKIGL